MDKNKLSCKRLSDPRDSLPAPPPNPQKSKSSTTLSYQVLPDAFKRLLDYKDREVMFLKALDDAITMDCKKIEQQQSEKSVIENNNNNLINNNNNNNTNNTNNNNSNNMNRKMSDSEKKSDCDLLREECENYIMPLLSRTGPSVSAALVSYDAFEQLNKLHSLLDNLSYYQEQNYQMKRYLHDLRTLCELKKLQKKDSQELLNECGGGSGDISDPDDLDNNASLLSTILAAGNSASTKRSSAKRQRERSKSVIGDDFQTLTENKLSSLRRQSAFSDTTTKSKVSKWTKVKAAFKWERANVPVLNEVNKSSDSGIGLTPINHEVARYLRVPSVPCPGSSADSILSSSSGHLLSGGSIPATPGTISSSSSIEDVGAVSEELRNNRDSSKSDSRCDSRMNEDETRRSRSLDGDVVINAQSISGQNKNKTPWRKVKDIIQTHRGSFKGKSRSRSVKSSGSVTGSRDESPCESLDAVSNFEERTDIASSTHVSPDRKLTTPALSITTSIQENENLSNSPGTSSPNTSSPGVVNPLASFPSPSSTSSRDEFEKLTKTVGLKSRRNKILSDFEALPEDVMVDLKTNYKIGKPPPSPLNLSGRQDSSDAEMIDLSYSPILFTKSPNKILKSKKPFTSANSSVPSSPSRYSEFFGEFESEELSSGDFSEPSTPHRKLSPKSSIQNQQEEINDRYMELRDKLTQEFEVKRQNWEKIRAACLASTSNAYQLIGKDETSKIVPAKLLEENLTADFKKKLHKWRVKKQNSVSNFKDPQTSPTKETEQKKIDWNLWKTGLIKLEGQGLQSLPEQKDLPEDFQKKLEQWKKMKESNTVPPYNSQDSLKRQPGKSGHSSKCDVSKRSKEDLDRDKHKFYERDKLEKLSKLKAMVAEPPAKEIEVQTSKGVMKFEGISRKFTRKLYEWEKARGIGPESSTFALLHPGYRPLDVGNGLQDHKSNENSPTLGRSLSLDSISPNPSVPSISHQPSSLSLNDVDELKETNNVTDRRISSNPELEGKNHQDEPEAVIVEVEDDIIETAAPLLTVLPIIEKQTPVYKYELSCQELCTGKETILHHSTILKSDKGSSRALKDVCNLTTSLHDHQKDYKQNIRHVQIVLSSLKDSLPELQRSTRGGSPHVREAFDIVNRLVREIMNMLETLNYDEACSKETLDERTYAIDSKLSNLQKSIDLICKYVELRKLQNELPEISVTSDDVDDKPIAIVSTTPTVFQAQVVINQPKILVDNTVSVENGMESIIVDYNNRPDEGSMKKINRNVSNGSKKKIRLRKMGSRQNSKTESDSDDDTTNVILEAPRRVKRKTSRAKKSFEEKIDDKKEETFTGEDIVYVLKIKPGQSIEEHEIHKDPNDSNVLISPTETCVELLDAGSQENVTSSVNVFVKTKRKIFTALEEPGGGESKSVIVRDIESSSASDRNEKENLDAEKKNVLKSLPPIPQSPNTIRKLEQKTTPPKEPSPSIRLMIAKYNQKLANERSTCSPISSGSCSPVAIRSPVLDRRVRMQTERYEKKVDGVIKSASAGNINPNKSLVAIEIPDTSYENPNKSLSKSSSVGTLSNNWKDIVQNENVNDESADYECSPPLACDSLKTINKNVDNSPKTMEGQDVGKKQHLYKKNKDKPAGFVLKTGAIKKITTKNTRPDTLWRRSVSSSAGEYWGFPPDKSDNTMPKIKRKYESKISPLSKSMSQTTEGFSFPSASAPTTPSDEYGRPKTPLTERAIKLQKAKEEFLKGAILRSASSNWEETNKDEIWKKRLSQVSAGTDSSNEECGLSKSTSVGTIDNSNIEGYFMENPIIEGYVSLPRSSIRSGKIASKFGLTSLASKLRKVKMRRGSKDNLPKMNAVSALCRQSLSIDIMPEINQNKIENEGKNLQKSGSVQAIGFGTIFRKNEKDKLNKSKSTHNIQNDK